MANIQQNLETLKFNDFGFNYKSRNTTPTVWFAIDEDDTVLVTVDEFEEVCITDENLYPKDLQISEEAQKGWVNIAKQKLYENQEGEDLELEYHLADLKNELYKNK
ncbi:hypothetical protein [Riemerella anatipestifer]|uniref:hypothetical protein n=1 Tax=Riemerella anatipestifer TaxID=34085 RepID=UPI0021D59653|nr:hypothetical protein [Riemerella anatipestifer]MCU7542953.1 hypothetical protein [Riemerella anatipestifer]MCW0513688.1 hypothetical protein [Riemerella anatipestifer]